MEEKIIQTYKTWELSPCPFCGSTDIGFKERVIERFAGGEGPCFAIKQVWAYCRYCNAQGRTATISAVYDAECIAAATEAWNKRTTTSR